MNKDDNSNWVRPDTRKGLIQLRLSPDGDGLIYFQWRDRTTGSVGLELTIFPGEAVWKRVKECTTGRVYVLEFTANKKLYFFWLQEPKEDKVYVTLLCTIEWDIDLGPIYRTRNMKRR